MPNFESRFIYERYKAKKKTRMVNYLIEKLRVTELPCDDTMIVSVTCGS